MIVTCGTAIKRELRLQCIVLAPVTSASQKVDASTIPFSIYAKDFSGSSGDFTRCSANDVGLGYHVITRIP